MERAWNDKELLNESNNKGIMAFYGPNIEFNLQGSSTSDFVKMDQSLKSLRLDSQDSAVGLVASSIYGKYKCENNGRRWSDDEENELRASSVYIATKAEFLRKRRQGIHVDENDLRALSELAKEFKVGVDGIRRLEHRVLNKLQLELEDINEANYAKRHVYLFLGLEQFNYKQLQKPISKADIRIKANSIIDRAVRSGYMFGSFSREAGSLYNSILRKRETQQDGWIQEKRLTQAEQEEFNNSYRDMAIRSEKLCREIALRALVIATKSFGGALSVKRLCESTGYNPQSFETQLGIWRQSYKV